MIRNTSATTVKNFKASFCQTSNFPGIRYQSQNSCKLHEVSLPEVLERSLDDLKNYMYPSDEFPTKLVPKQ